MSYPQPNVDDKRFNYGLIIDVAAAIKDAGYPEVTGKDFTRLITAMYRFIYTGDAA